ncbi:DUF2179 domain-containing protein [Helicovermis profundi]|uniref:UPF0316 protein HLPR_21060 n=1 Tax=Helicovermis profundi TaxID=3065157 RepID=A0AAU9E6N0_9FIRM|nr:DUF5698 domain-containing protein [Clostridia bacterium S502]
MGIWLYVFIVFAKIFEVSLTTVRIMFITKGEKKLGAIIGFFEVIIWIYVAGSVLKDVMSDPFKVIAYALGFALGNYFGSIVEAKIGLGLSKVEVIVKEEDGKELVDYIRDKGFAVTVLEGNGKNFRRNILVMYIARKKVLKLIEEVKEFQENSVITVSDTKPIYGGYGTLRK